jgi:hypothetical protein
MKTFLSKTWILILIFLISACNSVSTTKFQSPMNVDQTLQDNNGSLEIDDLYILHYHLLTMNLLDMTVSTKLINNLIDEAYTNYDKLFIHQDALEFMYYFYQIILYSGYNQENDKLSAIFDKFTSHIQMLQMENGFFSYSKSNNPNDLDMKEFYLPTLMATNFFEEGNWMDENRKTLTDQIKLELITFSKLNQVAKREQLGYLYMLLAISKNIGYEIENELIANLIEERSLQYKGGELDVVYVGWITSIENLLNQDILDEESKKLIHVQIRDFDQYYQNNKAFGKNHPLTVYLTTNFLVKNGFIIPNHHTLIRNFNLYIKKLESKLER